MRVIIKLRMSDSLSNSRLAFLRFLPRNQFHINLNQINLHLLTKVKFNKITATIA